MLFLLQASQKHSEKVFLLPSLFSPFSSMSDFKYVLDNSSKKHICPACGKKRLVRYIDASIGEYLPEIYGRCDREINCGYFLNPYTDGYKKDEQVQNSNLKFRTYKPNVYIPDKNTTAEETSYIPYNIFKQSRTAYDKNNFILFLISLFDTETVIQLISRYHLGTSSHWSGASVFWQIDGKGRIRTGKIMLYNPEIGRRIKEPFNHISWAHKALKLENYNLQQCFFGEHLLASDINSPVAIVESEKTALIASVYFPEFIWLAVGSLTNLSAAKCKCLHDRKVFLFPDLNCFEKWSAKAAEISLQLPEVYFVISDLLENEAAASDRTAGFDLADYLIRFDYHEINVSNRLPVFYPHEKVKIISVSPSEKCEKSDNVKTNFIGPIVNKPKHEPWDISGLETFFATHKIPNHPIQLNPFSKIIDPSLFVYSHLAVVKVNNGIPNYKPYFNRLVELKRILSC